MTIAIIVLSFSSCYEDAKPMLNISIEGTSLSRNVVLGEFPSIESVHLAVYHISDLTLPVSKISVFQGTSPTTTVSLFVPLGEVLIVMWLADGSSIVQRYGTVTHTMVEGDNEVVMPHSSFSIALNFSTGAVPGGFGFSWDQIVGATSYVFNDNGTIHNTGLNNYFVTPATSGVSVVVKSTLFNLESNPVGF